MTDHKRLKFKLYLEIRNTAPTKWSGMDSVLINVLATDDDVVTALENQHHPRRRTTKDACSMAGCGCASFRPKDESVVYCRCSHLTHDHYVKKALAKR